jgi:hypothetical protein
MDWKFASPFAVEYADCIVGWQLQCVMCSGRSQGDEIPRPDHTNRAAYQQVLGRRDGDGRSRNTSTLQCEQMGKQVRYQALTADVLVVASQWIHAEHMAILLITYLEDPDSSWCLFATVDCPGLSSYPFVVANEQHSVAGRAWRTC